MALTFYYGSGSPYAWRVWLALEHKRIHYELKLLSFDEGDLQQPEYAAINPRRKVPAIVDDGFALYESAAILEYLDECYDETPRLFPGDLHTRALVRRMVREADQYAAAALDALVGEVLYTPREAWAAAPIERAREALAEELDRWEATIAGEWLAGELSAADFTLYPIVALALRIERKNPDVAVGGGAGPPPPPGGGGGGGPRPPTAAWMGRVEALPFFTTTWPPHWR